MSIYQFTDYKEFLNQHILNLPKNGRGQAGKLAKFLRVSPVIVSQVLKGVRHFSEEQALEASLFFALTDLETEYFLLMVRLARAGTHRLQQRILQQIGSLQEKAKDIANRLPKKKSLDQGAKAQYYSYWYYGAIRLISSLESINDSQTIATSLGIPVESVQDAVEFLLDCGLVFQNTKGHLQWADQSTHVSKDSPLVLRHHQNWRQRGFHQMEARGDKDLFFTGPMVLGTKDADKIGKMLLKMIEDISHITQESPCEELVCLNMDWFRA